MIIVASGITNSRRRTLGNPVVAGSIVGNATRLICENGVVGDFTIALPSGTNNASKTKMVCASYHHVDSLLVPLTTATPLENFVV
ncbi:MAG: hypothetical protein ABSE80_13405 [Halobacteriota archaeon]|jgi:hypothetical protein